MKIYDDIAGFDGRNPVVTVGIFDGVHLGHRFILERLRETARLHDGESCLVTLWPHPRTVLNKVEGDFRLLNTLDEKKEILAGLGLQHLVVLPFTREFSRLSSCEFIEEYLVKGLGIQHLVVGYNHRFGRDREGDFTMLSRCAASFGFGIEKIPPLHPGDVKLSSSGIRQLVSEGKVSRAGELLGGYFSLSGEVVGGSRLGSSIGFPTANITPGDPVKLVPGKGVYAVIADLAGEKYKGMLNIGTRPTVNDDPERQTIEVHLLDFSQNIYHEQIRIRFVDKLREEMKFPGIEALKSQLGKDRETTRIVLRDLPLD